MNRNSFHVVIFVLAAIVSGAFAPAYADQSAQKSDVGFGLKGIGARIGFVDPEGGSGTVALGVHVDAGTIVRNVHVTPYFEYWNVGVNVQGYSVDRSDLTTALDVNADFPMSGSRITPYLGGGFGAHFLNESAASVGGPSESDTQFGFNMQGGVRNQVMPNISLFGEVRYAFISDASQLKIMGGFTYHFIY